MIGENAFDFLLPEERIKLQADLRKLLNEGVLTNAEYTIIGENGNSFTAELNAVLVRDEEGNPKSILSIARNITQRKNAEAEREALIRQLESKNTELERFAYTVSHDLKSPLITILGFLRLLEKEIEVRNMEEVKNYLERISNAAGRMQHLLDKILELARSGRMVQHREKILFNKIVEDALAMVSGQIREHTIQVEIAEKLPVCYGERIRLIEVMENLLDNAVKFMGDNPDPKITIGVRDDSDETVFFVRDNGRGIEEDKHEKIFELFQKYDTSAGAGAGLAIVKRIIEAHGGKIWVESDGRNQGSTFCFTLPNRTIDQSNRDSCAIFSDR